MSDRKLKYWLNQFLNDVTQEQPDTEKQIGMLRELAKQLQAEAAALEVVAAVKAA